MKTIKIVSLIFFLLAINALYYQDILTFDFLFLDDQGNLLTNPYFNQDFWSFFSWSFTATYKANWYPLTWLSWKLDSLWNGPDPFYFHLTNLLLHGVNGCLVFLLAYTFVKRTQTVQLAVLTGFMLSLIFIVHPAHIESVAWVTERKDVLYAAWYLLGAYTYLRFCLRQETLPDYDRRATAWYGLTILTFACSMMSKPMAISFPLVLLATDYYFGRFAGTKSSVITVLCEKAPFFLIALGSAVMTINAQGSRLTESDLGYFVRLVYAAKALILYFASSLVPWDVQPFYFVDDTFDPWDVVYLLAVVGFLVVFCVRKVYRHKPITCLLFLFVINLAPVLGLVQMGYQLRADRYIYIAQVIATAMAAYLIYQGLCRLKQRLTLGRWAMTVMLLAYLAFLSTSFFAYLPVWKNSDTLTRAIYEDHETNFLANFWRAKILLGQAQFESARPLLDECIRQFLGETQHLNIHGLYRVFLPEVYFLRGMVSYELRQFAEAISYFEESLTSQGLGSDNRKFAFYYMAYSHRELGDRESYLRYKTIYEQFE
ncbi:MAG: hypothetical protein JRD88_01085 [Deltaproteobacteria bacterium]|jgi:hypothetical protein|nr:hypothetical protein [Deltaproteobacteria bacterium]